MYTLFGFIQIRVARIGTRALRAVHGTEYEVGSSSDMLCKLKKYKFI